MIGHRDVELFGEFDGIAATDAGHDEFTTFDALAAILEFETASDAVIEVLEEAFYLLMR